MAQPPPVPPADPSATKPCPFCGEDIKSVAVVCRFCGMNLTEGTQTRTPSLTVVTPGPTATTDPQKNTHPFLKLIVIIFGLLFIISMIGKAIHPESPPAPKYEQGEPVASKPPSDLPVVEAPMLSSEYESNEVQADRKYKGRMLAVRGTVEKVGKSPFGDQPYVELAGSSLFGVSCEFSQKDEEQIVNLAPGDSVTIAGNCIGKFGSVNMKKCWIYQGERHSVKP